MLQLAEKGRKQHTLLEVIKPRSLLVDCPSRRGHLAILKELNRRLGFNKAKNEVPKMIIPGKLGIPGFDVKGGVLVLFPVIKRVLGDIRLPFELLQEIQPLFQGQLRRQPVKMPAFCHI
jgi:hypothetical protein